MTTIPAQSNLYSKDGGWPGLVTALYLPSGATRTNSAEFTTDEYTECGYTGPYTQPEYDFETQTLTWDSSSKSFTVAVKPEEWWIGELLKQRTTLLNKTDYAVLADTALSTSNLNLVKTLRQKLRDIPSDIESSALTAPSSQAEFKKILEDITSPCSGIKALDLTFGEAGF